MNAKTVMLCDCGECAKCRPDLHKKENECVRCGCYNLSEFKKVEHKHIHCLDCYKQQRNEKQRENRKQKKEKKCTVCKCGNMNLDDEHKGVPIECNKCSGLWCYDCGGDDQCDDCNEDVYVCKGCGENIGGNGFCTEGCRFGEYAGIWDCEKCGKRCEDCEFCPDCGEGDEECCDCTKMFSFSDCVKIQLEPQLWRCFDCCMKKELSDRGM